MLASAVRVKSRPMRAVGSKVTTTRVDGVFESSSVEARQTTLYSSSSPSRSASSSPELSRMLNRPRKRVVPRLSRAASNETADAAPTDWLNSSKACVMVLTRLVGSDALSAAPRPLCAAWNRSSTLAMLVAKGSPQSANATVGFDWIDATSVEDSSPSSPKPIV